MKIGVVLWLASLMMTGYSLYANLENKWLLMPPVWVMFIMTVIAFILIFRDRSRGRFLALVGTGGTAILLITALMLTSLASSMGAREYIKSVESPEGDYKVEVYRINPGASGGYRILAELHGALWFKKRIYNQERVEDIPVRWEDEHTVVFGELPLDLKEGETHGYGQ
ncbi:DUF5412 family protein [Salimicrobium halophilum]|uniref:Uncharacterized protein n=1 Tax=Salimicrobium halophilum TaxID=86666 RepID=A0A1G8R524_9BACI|nr:DUF5412 family protein [Salimicrobium halophilum]SDJ12081.1 hypothetical protein SAMN04490247_0831 [Salimicrobium halophilum]